MLITNGAGEFESDLTEHQEFEGDALLYLTPGCWHRYRPKPEVGWFERWISFNGDLIHRLHDFQLSNLGGSLLPLSDCEEFVNRFDALLDHIHAAPAQNSVRLSLHGLDLVAHAIELFNAEFPVADLSCNPRQSTDDPLINQALDIIWTQSHSPISALDIARQLGVTRRTLDRHFSTASARSVLQEINACRVSRAQRLLAETDLPIKTVAFLAGFSTSEQMRATFQTHQGESPSGYRAAHRFRPIEP